VEVRLLGELNAEPLAASTSGSDGGVVFKLVPQGGYYVSAYLKGIEVYRSEDREIEVKNEDVSKSIIVNAGRLNITVYDYDGEVVIRRYPLVGRLIRNGQVVGETETSDGVLRFGHTPFANYTLEILAGDLEVYSSPYEVDVDRLEGMVKAGFYDITVKVNASALANSTLAASLGGVLETSRIRLEFKLENGVARLVDVPAADTYTATLLYGERVVERLENVKIASEDQVVVLNLTGYRISVLTRDLDGEPAAANLSILLPGVGVVTSFSTNESGRGVLGGLLPLSYKIEARVGGIKVGEKSMELAADTKIEMTLNLMDVSFKIMDRDGEEVLKNTSIVLLHDGFEMRGEGDERGEIVVKDVPVETYRAVVYYYGFKVFDGMLRLDPASRSVELRAPGVLDAILSFMDAVKNPLDQGVAVISFGGVEVERGITRAGEVVLKNLPNVTMSVRVLYKGVEVPVSPSEFDLSRDDMRAAFVTSVYPVSARILRGDGKDLDVGEVLIYVNNDLKARYDLENGNSIRERLPQGDLRIQVRYRGRDAGVEEFYLDKPLEGLLIYSTLFPFRIAIYNPDVRPVEGAEVKIVDERGEIASLRSNSMGVAETLLPIGSYRCLVRSGDQTYAVKLELRGAAWINLLHPKSEVPGFEIAVTAGAANLFVSGLALTKAAQRGGGRPRGMGARRRPRSREFGRGGSGRIPRV